MTWSDFRQDCCFSKRYAFYRIGDEIPRRLGLHSLSNHYHNKKVQFITSYLETTLRPILDRCVSMPLGGIPTPTAPIWVFWWDGIENAPLIVQQCVKTIHAHGGTHEVRLITKANYLEYVNVPHYFIEKIQAGSMKLAHFADYLRVSLLAKYGGLWLDATIFCSQDIPENYFNVPFFTCRSEEQECRYISRMRWVTFVLGGYSDCLVYTILKEMFEAYWAKHNYAIDYLFFDHLIDLLYKNIPSIRDAIDQVPHNNLHRDDLQAAMCAALPPKEIDQILCEDTVLYKLSWRESYAEKTTTGADTLYGAFISGNLNI